MRLRLILLRHAKSDWTTAAQTDHERPLNKRGRKDAPVVAARIVEQGWLPDRVVSSDSTRTRETYERMQDCFQPPPAVAFLATLYHAGPRELSDALADIPDHVSTVMAIGHNPGWQEAVHWLSGEFVSMTTANAVLMSVDADSWPEGMGRAGFWVVEEIIRPKDDA
jgi:phosphohistidine phosphatase